MTRRNRNKSSRIAQKRANMSASAKLRWQRDHERRDWLAEHEPLPSGIAKRIIVIYGETAVRERTIYAWESPRDERRKRKELNLQ